MNQIYIQKISGIEENTFIIAKKSERSPYLLIASAFNHIGNIIDQQQNGIKKTLKKPLKGIVFWKYFLTK